ncbi:putative entry exclusion protein TrbK-alt [Sandaracinobacter sp. RS1-74]|uniref:putative entry exclusion protein TrbK-alt n=1 Tax=Sandaracinobacteroides sayramensis TaxID=2913411 RepID=UPI001EDB590A|nr:putative entry exclusion protein TrbK-alt [Sandaracinobacteroides sayramensis]MCG2840404.1 putative entry exclusion protein TrbK-alt [Sandaracinobacteroides sayramensis]
MSRSAKIAGVALAAGILLATAIVIAVDDRSAQEASPRIEAIGADPLRAELDRCRTLTMPDTGCEAAWEDHRRRFLGRDPADRQIDAETAMDAPDDGFDSEPTSDPVTDFLTQAPVMAADKAAATASEPGR